MPTDEALDELAERLARAVDEYAVRPNVINADAVTRARLEMFEAFVAAGWIAPHDRLNQMNRDRELLRQHAGWTEQQNPIPFPAEPDVSDSSVRSGAVRSWVSRRRH